MKPNFKNIDIYAAFKPVRRYGLAKSKRTSLQTGNTGAYRCESLFIQKKTLKEWNI
jgi:hypothetical protein